MLTITIIIINKLNIETVTNYKLNLEVCSKTTMLKVHVSNSNDKENFEISIDFAIITSIAH